jgi:predicted glycosyltransferase
MGIYIMNDDDKQLAPKMRKYIGVAARIAFCFNSSSMKDILRILQIYTVRHECINKLSKELYSKLEDSVIALKELDEYSKETKDKPS